MYSKWHLEAQEPDNSAVQGTKKKHANCAIALLKSLPPEDIRHQEEKVNLWVKHRNYFRDRAHVGEMTMWLRALVALLENLSSIPSTYIVSHNDLGLIPGDLTLSSECHQHQAHT